jgi:hypothetical protein
MPDNPITFIKGRENAMSAADNEWSQLLSPRVIRDGSIGRFEVLRNNVEDHYEKIGAEYLFDTEFQNI